MTQDARRPPKIRRAGPRDEGLLLRLEEECYDPERRSSPGSLRRSLRSPHQEVWLGNDDGAIIVWRRPRTWRVYGLHTRPKAQGKGVASRLLAHCEARARTAGAERMVLEADAGDGRLVQWYEDRGYRTTARRRDYYAPGRHAVRMERRLEVP